MSEIVQASSAEWEVLRVIWSLSQASSREVSSVLKQTQGWESATTKTLLGRLVKKGYLQTHKDGNRFIYTATVSETESVSKRVDDVFSTICSSRVGFAIADAIDKYSLTEADKQSILEAIQTKETVDTVPCSCVPEDSTCGCAPGHCTCDKPKE